MTGREKHYFAHGHTAQGFVSFYPFLLKGLQHRYLIKGAPGTGKSKLLSQLGQQALQCGHAVEYIHSALEKEKIDGIMIPSLQTAVVDASYPRTFEPIYPVVVDRVINMDEVLDADKLNRQSDQIVKLVHQMEESYAQAYDHFSKAKQFHLQRESLYAEGFDHTLANEVTTELINRFVVHDKRQTGRQRHLFFGAATAEGVVHFIDQLTEGVEVRIIIKGRPGSGKSTMLKRLAQKAEEQGLEAEVYHCGFDPNSLDMVILPQLKVAIVDGTAPHELEPDRPEDEIVDMYTRCFTKDIDQLYASELKELGTLYKAHAKQGIGCLAEARKYREELREIYQQAMDHELANRKLEWLSRTILKVSCS